CGYSPRRSKASLLEGAPRLALGAALLDAPDGPDREAAEDRVDEDEGRPRRSLRVGAPEEEGGGDDEEGRHDEEEVEDHAVARRLVGDPVEERVLAGGRLLRLRERDPRHSGAEVLEHDRRVGVAVARLVGE